MPTKLVDLPFISGGANSGFTAYVATKIVITADASITDIRADLADQYYNPGQGTYTMSLWTDDGGSPSKPSALVSGTEVTLQGSGLTMTFANSAAIVATLGTPQAVNAGTYWIVRKLLASSYCIWQRDYASGQGRAVTSSTDGSTWATPNADYYYISEVWGDVTGGSVGSRFMKSNLWPTVELFKGSNL